MFVGMSNNATVYNPKKNYDLVKEKQEFVLAEMKKEGFITNLKFASGVITTLTKGFGKFNSTLYALTGISVKVSDVFKNILGDK